LRASDASTAHVKQQHPSYSPGPPDLRYSLLPAATGEQHASFVGGSGAAAAAVEVGAAAVEVGAAAVEVGAAAVEVGAAAVDAAAKGMQ